MKVFKFKDVTDNRFAFVLAADQASAEKALREETSLEFSLIEEKLVEELSKPVVIYNKILPF